MIEEHKRQRDERSRKWQKLLMERNLLDPDSSATSIPLRVTRLEMRPGRIAAGIADERSGDCDVTIEMPIWQDEQWAHVLDLLSRQALYAAQMLAGDFPDELEPTLQEEGLSLLPAPHESVEASCTCCEDMAAEPAAKTSSPAGAATGEEDKRGYCRHIEAALQGAGDMFADDPWLLFVLRGRVREQVLRALRRKRRRNGQANVATAPGRTPQIAPQPASVQEPNALQEAEDQRGHGQPLAQAIHDFWGSARTQEQFRPQVVPPMAELILLRRLGPPAFSHANSEVYDTLADVYRRVTDAALALAYAEDPPQHEQSGDGNTESG